MRQRNMRLILITFVLFLMRGTVSSYFFDDDDEEEEPVHMPKILSRPLFLEVVAGEPVTFPCDVENLGDFVVLWRKSKTNRVLFADDLRVTRDNRFQMEGTSLQLTSVQATDSSEYACIISTNPSQELVHTLNVLYPPSVKAKLGEAYVAAKEGETVTLMCEATGNPVPEIKWKYAGRHYDSSNNNSYVIANAQKSDSGEYECIADNDVGEPATTTITLEIVYDEEVEEPVHMPKILSRPLFLEVVVGEPVTFPCDVENLGDFVLLWKREKYRILFAGGLKVILDDRIQTDGTSLQITSVQATDSGEYTCQITTNPPLELVHTLDVLYPPSVKAKRGEAYVAAKEGETVTLMCEATGNPVPEITWKYAGRHYDSSNNNSYVIANAQKRDSGEYECIADNDIGEPATTTITLKIVSAPKVNIEPQSGLVVVKEGEPISIGCRATGDPTPFITWKKPNGEKMIKISDVNIAEASKADAGNYECIANNSFGITTSAVIRVQVLFPPKVRMSHSKVHTREGANVNITCVIEGEPVPSITWKKDDSQTIHSNEHYHLKMHGHSIMLIIHHIEEQDFGKYECTASNSLSSATGITHLTGTPQVPIFTSKPYSNQERKFTISWKVNSDVPVDEFSLSYRKKLESAEWKTISVPASKGDDEEMYTQMFQLVELQPATEYEAVIKARNKYGWSEQSENFVFKTKNEEVTFTTPSVETTEAPTISEHCISATEVSKCFQHCMMSTAGHCKMGARNKDDARSLFTPSL